MHFLLYIQIIQGFRRTCFFVQTFIFYGNKTEEHRLSWCEDTKIRPRGGAPLLYRDFRKIKSKKNKQKKKDAQKTRPTEVVGFAALKLAS